MTQKVFTVYDSKAEAYLRPFFTPTKGLALRSFADAANDPREPVGKYPGDYTLFELGEYDDATGIITMHESKINMGTANEHIRINPDHQLPSPNLQQLPSDQTAQESDQRQTQ